MALDCGDCASWNGTISGSRHLAVEILVQSVVPGTHCSTQYDYPDCEEEKQRDEGQRRWNWRRHVGCQGEANDKVPVKGPVACRTIESHEFGIRDPSPWHNRKDPSFGRAVL